MAAPISWASAVESAPLPSRSTTPLTRLSRPAASSPSTTSITVTGRLPKSVTLMHEFAIG